MEGFLQILRFLGKIKQNNRPPGPWEVKIIPKSGKSQKLRFSELQLAEMSTVPVVEMANKSKDSGTNPENPGYPDQPPLAAAMLIRILGMSGPGI